MRGDYFGHVRVPLERIHLELTNVCDFNCTFCPKSQMTRPPGFIETGLAKRTIKEIAENGLCEKVTFHVMGEPTLHRDFFDILSYAQDVGVKVGLTTNGGGLGGDTGRRLLEYDLHQIDVSLQTPDARSFALRKARSHTFDSYVAGILSFFHAYKSKGRDGVFKFRFLNTRFRKREMEKSVGQLQVLSSTQELREALNDWAGRVYDLVGATEGQRTLARQRIGRLAPYKWNVVEVCPGVFFETYLLEEWGHAFGNGDIRDAWGGYCFGMKDHFAVLCNGDVTLCCVDFDGRTKVGNLNHSSLREILSSDTIKRIIEGFGRLQLVHPHCARCLGSRTVLSWVFKPIVSATVLKTLKPFFYKHTRLYE